MKFRLGESAKGTAAILTLAVACGCAILTCLPDPGQASPHETDASRLKAHETRPLAFLVNPRSVNDLSVNQSNLPQKPPAGGHPGAGVSPVEPGALTSSDNTGPRYGSLPPISKEDMHLFASLPPMCTADLKQPLADNTRETQPSILSPPPVAGRPVTDAADIAQAWEDAFQKAFAGSGKPDAGKPLATRQVAPEPQATRSPQTTINGSVNRIAANVDLSNQPIAPTNWHASAPPSMPDQAGADSLAAPHGPATRSTAAKPSQPGVDPHAEIYSRTPFPSARQCAQCHQQIYDEWALSSHAYASISPMFHVFEETINRLSQGTIGYFCYRCHSPVSTTMGLRRDQPIWDGPQVFREGVTCVACHRVNIPYGKADGERRIEPGDLFEPVYGAGDGQGVAIAEKYKAFFNVTTDRQGTASPAQPIHRRAIQFDELSKSTFCMSCHQVAVEPGIKLEVVWDQYRASPAYRQGISCQDCHMGKVPGVDEGYAIGPGAVVNGKVVQAERKHANHIFYGPGYSIAHPGVFPDHVDADRWTVAQWLEFDWRAGWGTEAFENALSEAQANCFFPPAWANADDRYDAREIVDANLKKLETKKDLRRQVLENGSQLDGPFFTQAPRLGQPLSFRYCVTNLNAGHNLPSGSLGAQPQVWMNVVLIAPDGKRLWETGYLDSNGDLADNHSIDVLMQKLPLDTQLMNLQTKFLTTNVKGTDREMYLPINFDIDQIPFLRPPQQPVSVLNHPPLIRMEQHSIPPLGKRNAKFSIPARLVQMPGTYRLSVRMRSRAEPVYFMRFCNATPEMERMMNEWICDFHASTVMFDVH